MNDMSYPVGVDSVWLALDRDGYCAAFVTAGAGPIPERLLASGSKFVEDSEEAICRLPVVSGVDLLVPMNRPDDFIEMAERGFFVYDWQDVHRSSAGSTGLYELVAVPHQPVDVALLPVNLAVIAKLVVLQDVRFTERKPIDVRGKAACLDGEGCD